MSSTGKYFDEKQLKCTTVSEKRRVLLMFYIMINSGGKIPHNYNSLSMFPWEYNPLNMDWTNHEELIFKKPSTSQC